MVSVSPWPILGSFSILGFLVNSLQFVNLSGSLMWVFLSSLSLFLLLWQWWKDVVRESTFQGEHSKGVQKGLYLGMMMFILSEVMFFFSFFFGFFSSSLVPDVWVGGIWPPVGVQPMSFLGVPLLNTLILLSSGISITWCHHAILEGSKFQSFVSGLITVGLGLIFIFFQVSEYFECQFSICDSVFGSFFFIMTGFHGFHVGVGVLMIVVSVFRLFKSHFSHLHFVGFELSAWYWHFVDVVWLFLFLSVYWWGS